MSPETNPEELLSDDRPIETAELHAALAGAANAAARLSRLPGAPVLDADSTREDLIAWLAWNDSNGCYTDDALRAEGEDPLTLDGAWEELAMVDLEDVAKAWG